MEHSSPEGLLRNHLESGMRRYMRIFEDMVSINSHTENAAGVNRLGDYTAKLFSQLGFTAEFVQSVVPEYGRHVVLRRSGSAGVTIGCVSHLDTVFDPEEEKRNDFCWRIDGDRAYGPGTNDIKGGTLVMYMMLDAMSAVLPDLFNAIDWVLLFDASEETESDDFGELCIQRMGSNACACLVFEGGEIEDGMYTVVVARKGRSVFKVAVEGRGAHAGTAHHQGASAILQVADIVKIIEGMTDYPHELTYNVGILSGGSALNRVPHHAEAHIEMRAFDPEALENGIASIMKLQGYSSVTSADGGYRCTTTISQTRRNPSWPANDDTARLFASWEKGAHKLGMRLRPERRGGLSDGNFTWNHVPTIDGLGPVGGNCHCSERSVDGGKDQEYSLISSLVPKTLINIFGILRYMADYLQNAR